MKTSTTDTRGGIELNTSSKLQDHMEHKIIAGSTDLENVIDHEGDEELYLSMKRENGQTKGALPTPMELLNVSSASGEDDHIINATSSASTDLKLMNTVSSSTTTATPTSGIVLPKNKTPRQWM